MTLSLFAAVGVALLLGLILSVVLIRHLAVNLRSKRLRTARRYRKEFLRSRKGERIRPVKIHDSARSRKDLQGWDFVYQRNRWIAENSELVESAKLIYEKNLKAYELIAPRAKTEINESPRMGLLLRRLEAKKVEKTLAQMIWPKGIQLLLSANYTSPAGRVNVNRAMAYFFDFNDSTLAVSTDGPAVESVFDRPESLQFPGVYVYSYPAFMGTERFPLKIGKSESSIYARVRQQTVGGGAAIPQDPVIVCAIRSEKDAGAIEARLHASFRRHRTQGGGTEWFNITLQELRAEFIARGYSSTWSREFSYSGR